jgi:hypothetical protein
MDLGWPHLVPYTATNGRSEQPSDRLDRRRTVSSYAMDRSHLRTQFDETTISRVKDRYKIYTGIKTLHATATLQSEFDHSYDAASGILSACLCCFILRGLEGYGRGMHISLSPPTILQSPPSVILPIRLYTASADALARVKHFLLRLT